MLRGGPASLFVSPLPMRSLACAAALAAALLLACQRGEAPPAPPRPKLDVADAKRIASGKTVYAQHCAACHGVNLEGQPEWKRLGPDGRMPAPPHDASGHTWHHPDAYLIRITRDGFTPGVDRPAGYQSNMPAFGKLLSELDIVAALTYIKSTWPIDHQDWQEATNKPGAKLVPH